MKALLGLSRAIDSINTAIGKLAMWFILIAILVSTINAIIRKVFSVSSNAWLELQWVLFGAVFLLCASWTLIVNEHIRIDIINQQLSRRARNWIEMIGHLFFLLPMCLVLLYTSIPFFTRSFMGNEQSLSAGGLPQWPAKFLVPAGFLLLTLQAISEIIKRAAIMRGDLEDTHSGGGHHSAAEAEAERLLALAKAEQQT